MGVVYEKKFELNCFWQQERRAIFLNRKKIDDKSDLHVANESKTEIIAINYS